MHHAIKTYLVLNYVWRSGGVAIRVRRPGTRWVGGWIGLRVGLEAVAKINPSPCREWNPGRPARILVAILTDVPLYKEV